ncbi:helix-turn-helix domain-containing protein [Paenibacillus sedimenti]|uniref:Helix-turn-helix transcriptional regulator n=1 Tax=Paenibacillus sedimenti TaxID=2770274 RepID=A0A926KPU3_9BACL|nr:helix-turn-helix transcriptional regulator [Paenibacillus sedimenti]MBD0380123.1 helix-turn-helix transcriptional regulator [Paenibacillus sedimenti]
MSVFKNRIQELRMKKGTSQDELAAFLGRKRATVSNYELGKTEPQYADLVKIADYFNVTVDYLLGRPGAEKHYFASNSSSALPIEEQSLLDQFLKDTEALLREKGNLDEDKLAYSLKFMEFTFLEDLEESKRSKK